MQTSKIVMITAAIRFGAGVSAASFMPKHPDASVNLPADRLQFYRYQDGSTFANAWGHPSNGPHSNYMKLAGNAASPPHIHTSSYYGVLIGGTVSNERRPRPDQPLDRGFYWFQKGGKPHITRCLSTVDCLIFVTSHCKFDTHPVNDPPNSSEAVGQRR